MLRLCGVPDSDQELALFIPVYPVQVKHVTLVAVASFIERPHQPDAGLNR